MSPTPIQPGFVHFILQYIAPPSQLTQPIPSHLLSKPLLQRHHFLQLTLDNPQEYLCWPTSGGRAVEVLENLPRQWDDGPGSYPVQYTSDAEQVHAHVGLHVSGTDGVRMVLEWDEADGWKYHDLAMMPFPPGSYARLQEPAKKQTEFAQPAMPFAPAASFAADPYAEDEGDDDYWNAYGSQDDAAPFDDDPFMASKDAEAGTEDAYWARYSSVHGTADSTRPSPPPQPKRKLQSMGPDCNPGTDSPNPISVPARSDSYYSHGGTYQTSFAPPGNPRWDPASPRALAQLLADVPPRSSPSPSPLSAPGETDLESEVSSPTVGGSSGSNQGDPTSLPLSGEVLPAAARLAAFRTAVEDEEEADISALRDSIRGLWKLWEMGRRKRRTVHWSEDDTKLFLEIVRDVVSVPSS